MNVRVRRMSGRLDRCAQHDNLQTRLFFLKELFNFVRNTEKAPYYEKEK